MNKTKINWCDYTWNPITGCTKIMSGCKNCYAESIAKRFWGERKFTDVQFHPERLNDPKLRSKKPMRIFVNSMSDLFHEKISFKIIENIYDLFFDRWICYPDITFMILTKRIKRALEFYDWMHDKNRNTAFDNVWFGYSASTQRDLNVGIDYLQKIDAKVRWLSLEPLVEPINILSILRGDIKTQRHDQFFISKIKWVVVGSESGTRRRNFDNKWAESLIAQCKEVGVPIWIKQIWDKDNKVIEDINLFPKELQVRQLGSYSNI